MRISAERKKLGNVLLCSQSVAKNQRDGSLCSLTWKNKLWEDFRFRWEFVALLTQGIPLLVLTEDILLSDIPPHHRLVFPDWGKVLRNTWKWVIVMTKEWRPEEASITVWCRIDCNEKTETKHLGHRMRNSIRSFFSILLFIKFSVGHISLRKKMKCKNEVLRFE